MLAYIMKEAKKYSHIIMTVENGTPVLQYTLKEGDDYKKSLEYVKTGLKEILEEKKAEYQKYKLDIVETKEFIQKVLKYTHSSQVYETDSSWFEFIIDEEESWTKLYENRFQVVIDSRDYPECRLTLHMHDRLKDKYYVADKLHMNPRKWGFDFDDDNAKAPFTPSEEYYPKL